ncbi:MAG TPA: hypothetical protein VHO70_22220 [Chitinispirillaceae bacterium]|nr:hypothetical protein [Chitinispirillaceae bacterium]
MSIYRITLIVIHLLLLTYISNSFGQPKDTVTAIPLPDTLAASKDSLHLGISEKGVEIPPHTTEVPDSNVPAISSASKKDSISINNHGDLIEDSVRMAIFNRNTILSRRENPFHYSTESIYRSDASSTSEMLADNPFLVAIPFGLANSLNRTLYFGNTAPITKIRNGRIIANPVRNPFQGTDQYFLSALAEIDLEPGTLAFTSPSGQFSTPEVHIFWENGVFKENNLNVRFSRPFTKNLTAHFYSNYRYFNGQTYSHQGNDIFDFFSNFQDSVDLSYKGYTPLVNERLTGAGFDWHKNQRQFSLSAQYGEFNNEISLDTSSQSFDKSPEKTINANYFRYPFSFTGSAVIPLSEKLFSTIEATFQTEPIKRITASNATGSLRPSRKDANITDFDGMVKSGFQLSKNDSVGLLYSAYVTRQTLYNDSLRAAYQHAPSIFYSKGFELGGLKGNVTADGGVIFSTFRDSLFTDPRLNLTAQIGSDKRRYRLFINQEILPLLAAPDTLPEFEFTSQRYFRAGTELFHSWNRFNLTVGYQYVSKIDSLSIAHAWPLGRIPYQQPRSTFTIAPAFMLSENMSFYANAMFSDSKPYIKAFGKITYTAHPFNTSEFIDVSLYANYWSERDLVLFAGKNNWNKPVLHPGLEIAAHIKTFRLYYKVDNLLNREFAYVPGYYNPGITFRWGFNWFIQR